MLNTILLQAADGAPAGGAGWSSMIMIIALIAIFYFFMIAPQKKREKKINEFRNNLKNGDKVVTIGGIYGRIREVKDNAFILEIADGVRIKVDKSAISMQDNTEVPTK
jgi:preprotein translocase subunit YajC